jgi:hypothetical protein
MSKGKKSGIMVKQSQAASIRDFDNGVSSADDTIFTGIEDMKGSIPRVQIMEEQDSAWQILLEW